MKMGGKPEKGGCAEQIGRDERDGYGGSAAQRLKPAGGTKRQPDTGGKDGFMEEKELNAELIQLIEDKVRVLMAEKDENPDRAETLDERERLLRQRELRAETIEALAEKKLPAELADAISYADEETCHAGLLAVERAFRTALQKAVDERLRGNAPSAGKAADPETMDDRDYYRMKIGM